MKTILLTGGGTAGHVTPNLALIPSLKAAGYDIRYIGSYNGMERKLIENAGIPYDGISSGKLRRYFDLKNFSDPFRVLKGYGEARKLIKKYKPDVLFSKGGFVAVPVVLAAKHYHVPTIIHESDMTPGLANKLCIPSAKKVCCNFPETLKYLPEDKAVLTGSPIRAELLKGDRLAGLQYTHLSAARPIILVIGGLGKALTLVIFTHKRTDHASARKAFAADKRDTVELCLQLLVVRNTARHDNPEHQANGGRANQKDDAELKVDGKGRDHGARRQEGPADEHAHAQRHGELHLVDVVGNARDERRRAKTVEFGIAQLVDVLVERAANVGAHALRGERRHLLADERKRDADHSHGGEHHAVVDDGTHVVRTDTFIDHLGNHQRRKQVKDHFDQLARRANHHISAKLTTKTPEQLNHKKALPIIISLQSDS